MRKYNQAFLDRAHELYNKYRNMCEVSRQIGVHPSQIWRWKAANWKIRKRKTRRKKYIAEANVPIGQLNDRELIRAIMNCNF